MSNDVTDPRILRFAYDAHSFCAFVDSLITAKPADCYTQLLRVLSSLAASGNDLPFATPEPKVAEDLRMTEEEFSRLSRSISGAVFPEANELVERYLDDENELTRAFMLWDDLADIYRDLKDGLTLFALATSDARSAAIGNWQFGYEYHWGDHLMRALVTVHEIRFDLHVE
jgi:hypothetical protein